MMMLLFLFDSRAGAEPAYYAVLGDSVPKDLSLRPLRSLAEGTDRPGSGPWHSTAGD